MNQQPFITLVTQIFAANMPDTSALEKQIDKMVYALYGLIEEDIAEVENWYARRYPKLVKAQNNKKG